MIKAQQVNLFLKELEELCVKYGVELYRDDPFCSVYFDDDAGKCHCIDE